MFKQVIVVRDDLKLSKGKLAVQVAHASLCAYRKASKLIKKLWELEGEKKVVLHVKNLEQLKKIKAKADKLKLKTCLIADAGRTELKAGTITALAIGPNREGKINKVSGSLPLLS